MRMLTICAAIGKEEANQPPVDCIQPAICATLSMEVVVWNLKEQAPLLLRHAKSEI